MSGRLGRLPEPAWVMLLGVVALLVRLVWIGAVHEREPRSDETEYVGHATRLAEGLGYTDRAGEPAAFWPPGYPAALSLSYRALGRNAAAELVLQVALGIAACFALYLVGRQTLPIGTARAAALAMALYPNMVLYSSLRLSEPLFILLLLLALALLLRSRGDGGVIHALLAGVLFGAATLVRPQTLLFPLLLPLWYWITLRSIPRALVLGGVVCIATVLTISPWLARNHEITGRWTDISTNGGYNFWLGNNPEAFGGTARAPDFADPLRTAEGGDWRRGYGLGLEAIRDDPAAAALRAGRKITYLVALETDGVLWNFKWLDAPPALGWTLMLLAVVNLAYVAVLAGGVLGLLSPGRPDGLAALTLLLIAYLLVITVVFVGDPRYHMPVVPLLILFGAYFVRDGAPAWLAGLRAGERAARTRLRLAIGILATLLLLIVANLGVKLMEVRALGGGALGQSAAPASALSMSRRFSGDAGSNGPTHLFRIAPSLEMRNDSGTPIVRNACVTRDCGSWRIVKPTPRS